MPKSFDEYAVEKGIVRSGTNAAFFEEHPELIDEVRKARAYPPAQWKEIHAWLCAEYGYPLKDVKGIADYLRSLS